MSAIIIDDKIVHYEVLGRGKPIIFLHGWVGSWRYWIPAMQAASTSYRAYAFDLWGFGETAKDAHLYALNQQTELLDAFMNAMGIGKVALIGHGLGAAVALQYAARHPFVVDRVMVISAPTESAGLVERAGSTLPADLASRLLEPTSASDAARKESAKTDPEAIRIPMQELQKLRLEEDFSQMSTAALLVSGLRDPLSATDSASSDLPTMFHQITFDESGHYPMLDQPNKFHRLMNDFLDLPSGESPRQLQVKEEWKRRVR